MKVIDLLNKIANGNIPKRIIYDQYVYQWNNIIKNYEREVDIYTTLNWDHIAIECLNEEIEIIEEDKKIEKLESYINCGWNGTCKDYEREELYESFKKIGDKINEIIDYIKENK